MSVEDVFGLNSWLLKELRLKELQKGEGLADFPTFLESQNGIAQSRAVEVSDHLDRTVIRVFENWLSDWLWLLADLSPLNSTRKFFRSRSPAELAREFVEQIGLDRDFWMKRLAETATRYVKPLAPRFGDIPQENKKFLLDRLYSSEDNVELRDVFLRGSLRAQLFEEFLHKRYVGQKRFSIEGLEGFIGALEALTVLGARHDYRRIALSMAHRGRLSTLYVWAGLPLEVIANAFEKKINLNGLLGDVKYHWGVSSVRNIENKSIFIDILPNPSHLEAINPVLFGFLKAISRDDRCFGIIAHGNSALCGQGVNQEVLNFLGLPGFETPPVIHFVLDNMVGFTASPQEEKNTMFASDLFRAYGIPVVLVNGTDFDATLRAVSVAFEYIDRFKKDIVVHLFGYRKYGHNEGDDPTVTQPLMYEEIKKRTPAPVIYLKNWGFNEEILSECAPRVQEGVPTEIPVVNVNPKREKSIAIDANFARDLAEFLQKRLSQVVVHTKVAELFERRISALLNDGLIDWGLAELIVYALAMRSGFDVRLVGEDSRRGTFAHRHAYVWDLRTEEAISVLDSFANRRFEVYNSSLSEYGSLGYEIGYSLGATNTFCLWEAQFGDFVNGAQIVLDQFLSSSQEKWGISFPITLLLPHGQEGAGPEHSSARLERFLQLSAGHNWRIFQPSTVSSYFAILRSQITSNKPCVILTPKSLLRANVTFAKLSELYSSKLSPYILYKNGGSSLLICTGKIVYKLRELIESNDVKADILCLEQLYPVDEKTMGSIFDEYETLCIVQEEPANQGVAGWLRTKFYGKRFELVSHPESATTAVGLESLFEERQRAMFEQLLGLLKNK